MRWMRRNLRLKYYSVEGIIGRDSTVCGGFAPTYCFACRLKAQSIVGRDTVRSRFQRRLRAVTAENFVLPTSQTEKPIAAFRLLRRTLRVLALFERRQKEKTIPFGMVSLFGDPDGIRTRVTAVKGRCLRPLDHRALIWWL